MQRISCLVQCYHSDVCSLRSLTQEILPCFRIFWKLCVSLCVWRVCYFNLFISSLDVRMTSIKLTDLFSFAWSYTNSRITDYYRHYFSEVVTVTTKSGPVKGYKIASAFDYRYINFLGIPYAKAPVGELRFKVCVDVNNCN